MRPRDRQRLLEDMDTHGFDEDQPIIVTVDKSNRATIIDGRNRWSVAKELGIQDQVPCRVVDWTAGQVAVKIRRLNINRRHLNKKEMTVAYMRLHPKATHAEVAKAVGVSQSTVSNANKALNNEDAPDAPARVDAVLSDPDGFEEGAIKVALEPTEEEQQETAKRVQAQIEQEEAGKTPPVVPKPEPESKTKPDKPKPVTPPVKLKGEPIAVQLSPTVWRRFGGYWAVGRGYKKGSDGVRACVRDLIHHLGLAAKQGHQVEIRVDGEEVSLHKKTLFEQAS